ncbi:MAG: hypothetical protein HYU77_05660 [Betaproteobacteria bacterium]|nr:hypothetical protein [Betaproteobacteria bacterium]
MKRCIGGFAFSASSFLLAASTHGSDDLCARGTFTTSFGGLAAGNIPLTESATAAHRDPADYEGPDGPTQGYFTLSQNGDTVIARWKGSIASNPHPNGLPKFLVSGNWSYLNGTGRYRNIRGHGSFTGRFLSRNEYAVEWSGRFSIGEI